VIPKPPFADELTREQELAAFERLKPRLNEVWDVVSAQEDLPATSIVVPSFTLDQEELTKLDGAAYYEERLLFLLIRLRNPRAHVTYVTSQPVMYDAPSTLVHPTPMRPRLTEMSKMQRTPSMRLPSPDVTRGGSVQDNA
jgi:hypothetical protein